MPDVTVAVRRVAVPAEPLVDAAGFDYSDSFALQLDRPDAHSAEHWVRTALEHGGLRRLILLVHRHVLRFRLGPADDEHILGWRIVTSTYDALQLATSGSFGSAVIVARRTSPTGATVTTFVRFDSAASPYVWLVVGPMHRRVAPYLLKRAAATFRREQQTAPAAP